MDASGQISIPTIHPLWKTLQDKDKEVEQVPSSEGQAPQSAFERVEMVIFASSSLTHYAWLPCQASKKRKRPDRLISIRRTGNLISLPTSCSQWLQIHLIHWSLQSLLADQLTPTTSTQLDHQEEEHKDMVDQEIHQLLGTHRERTHSHRSARNKMQAKKVNRNIYGNRSFLCSWLCLF